MNAPQYSQVISSRYAFLTLEALRDLRAGAMVAQPEIWAARAKGTRAGDIAVIPVMGLLTHRGSWYGMAIDAIRRAHRAAIDDASIVGIVYEYDTPGGEVYAIDELAAEFRADRDVKPSVGISHCQSCSAGYYLMAQHSEVLVSPSSDTGSVGVYGIHMDWSRALDEMGITVTIVSAGEGKVDGNPYEPLTPEAQASMQADINRYYGMFVSAVAKGRGVTADVVKGEWQAKVYGAKDAVSIKMADAIGTLDDAVRRVGKIAGQRKAIGASADVDAERIRRARSRVG